MSRPALPRLPIGPLLDELLRRETTVHEVAAASGLDCRRVYRSNALAWETADRWAVALGLHPSSLWGEDWWAVARTYDARPGKRIKRSRAGQRVWGRPAVSARWDPLHPREHVCAVDGCGCDYKVVSLNGRTIGAGQTGREASNPSHPLSMVG